MLRSKIPTLSITLFCLLSGCAVIDRHGHEVSPDQLKPIQVGVTTKQQVGNLLGSPSAVSTFNNATWFYMSKTTSRRAFFDPIVLKSNITRIGFNDKDIVTSVDSLTEADSRVISHVSRQTPTSGQEFNVVEQIFGNFGKFNGKDPDASRGGP